MKKEIKSKSDKKLQRKYQLIVVFICLSVATVITLLLFAIHHL